MCGLFAARCTPLSFIFSVVRMTTFSKQRSTGRSTGGGSWMLQNSAKETQGWTRSGPCVCLHTLPSVLCYGTQLHRRGRFCTGESPALPCPALLPPHPHPPHAPSVGSQVATASQTCTWTPGNCKPQSQPGTTIMDSTAWLSCLMKPDQTQSLSEYQAGRWRAA